MLRAKNTWRLRRPHKGLRLPNRFRLHRLTVRLSLPSFRLAAAARSPGGHQLSNTPVLDGVTSRPDSSNQILNLTRSHKMLRVVVRYRPDIVQLRDSIVRENTKQRDRI